MGTGQPSAAPIPTRPKGPMQNRWKAPAPLTNAPLARAKRLARSAPDRARRATDGARIRARRAIHRRGYVPGLLSIVVPCYRVEDFLDECLISLRFQQYREVEIIVVDDGSPDRSGEIARHHARRDLRVRVVTRENGGLSAARNTGIEHARGEFLTFVDSDDTVTPEAYSTAMEALHGVRLGLRAQLLRPAREQDPGPGRGLDPRGPCPPPARGRPRLLPRRDGQRRRLEQDLPT